MWASRCAVAMVMLLVPARIEAQAPAPDIPAAARAFQQAQQAQLRGDHGAAAELFELADRIAPSVEALRSAIRNRLVAEQWGRAATLGLSALARYPTDASTRELADRALARASSLGRVRIRCSEPCLITLDGVALSTIAVQDADLFVDAGPHVVAARFGDGGTTEKPIEAESGQVHDLSLEPPEPVQPEPPVATVGPDPEPEPAPIAASNPAPRRATGGGLPIWLPLATAGATVVALGLSIWSGLDTLSARDEYVTNPTRAGFEDGIARENRTNALIGVTVAFGLTAALMALFTDWTPNDEAPVAVDLGPGNAHVRGAF